MKAKLVIILAFFSLLALGASFWQAYEASRLEDRLLEIDRQTQAQRLMELSLPRVKAELHRLLEEERAKLPPVPNVDADERPEPLQELADFNLGYFLRTPAGLLEPTEPDDLDSRIREDAVWQDVLIRKADNPSAPIFESNGKQSAARSGQVPVFGIFRVKETDFSKPIQAEGEAGDFYPWVYGDVICYTRNIPTSHGQAIEGFCFSPEKLAERLFPLVEPGLAGASITLPKGRERSNIGTLPLVLRPGEQVALPDTGARKQALLGTVVSAWIMSGLSILILFGLLACYARLERRRSDFVSAVTHELRTPLTSFNLYTEMLREGKVPPEKVAEYHETLYQESRRLGHLVENVLALARLSRGKVRGRQDAGPCAKLLGGIFERISERMRQAGVRVIVTQDPRTSLLSLRTDLLSVEQILTNLADNAAKYARVAHPTLTFSVVQSHRSVTIRVSDNGPGIAPDVQRSLFRPFSRSAESDRRRKPGIGLGLALSRDLARSIGGDLALEKSDGRGATFALTLPLGE